MITASPAEVAESIRSGGLANVKAPRIQAVLREIETRNGGFDLSALATLSVADARAELMSYPGVGPKTASCVLLFALGKAAMPVDTHVHRVAKRLGLIPLTASAEKAHALLECQLGDDRDSAYAFHMHVIRHGRTTCLARRPACDRCCLSTWCNDFNSRHP